MPKRDRGMLALPEPWETIQQIGLWGEWVANRTHNLPAEYACAEMRDALKSVARDLLNVAKIYPPDIDRANGDEHELVPRYAVMTVREDGSIMPSGVFTDERMAEEHAARSIAEPNAVRHAFVRKQWVPVALERLNETMARIVAASGLSEDELADAVTADSTDAAD